jgi:hydroxyethylthiazole kinase
MRSADRATIVPGTRALTREFAPVVAAVRAQAPRVQCLTNTVAQALTANVLHALGAGASMATHPDEVIEMSRGAGALLVNLGTPDSARVAAVERLFDGEHVAHLPVVLDPVFVQASPLRRDLARDVARHPRLLIKGNAAEVAALKDGALLDPKPPRAWITTGATNRVESGGQVDTIAGGHPWMAAVTGLGCALGAVVAACAAVTADDRIASCAALALFADAGRTAGASAQGPGSFAVHFIDALHYLSIEAAA